MRADAIDESPNVEVRRMRRISFALFLAGFATFSLIYCTQPLLPTFAAYYHVDAAQSSLAVSLTTACLAVSILCAGVLSETLERHTLMFASIALSALLNILAGFAPGWEWLLVARGLEGIALGGVPAVAMAYLAEEVPPSRLGMSMGLYVSGTAFGGMIGRVAIGGLAEAMSWRNALATVGLIDLIIAFLFLAMLPHSRNFRPRKNMRLGAHLAAWRDHLRTPYLPALYLVGFLALGAFMAVYNYIGFKLSGAPYNLNAAQIGLIFFAYLGGVAASFGAGAWADKAGRAPVMLAGALTVLAGIGLTLMAPLAAVIAGVATITIGFFMVHSIASGWVGRIALRDRGHASALYLLSYYAGASIIGSSGGWVWRRAGWDGVAAYVGLLFAIVLGIAVVLFGADKRARVAP